MPDHYDESRLPILVLQNADEDVAEGAWIGADADGAMALLGVRFTFDPSGDTSLRTVASHGLGVYVPDNAVIQARCPLDIVTGVTGSGASVAIQVESAGDILGTTVVASLGPGGINSVPDGTAANRIKTTARREVTAVVSGGALTAGKIIGWIPFTVSE